MTASHQQPERVPLSSLIGGLAHDIAEVLPTGDVAELRRMNPDEALAPAFWKLVVHRLEPAKALAPDTAPWSRDREQRWATIVACLAENRGLHDPSVPAGRGLAVADVAEMRVLRLLRARGAPLRKAVRVISHHIAAEKQRLNWTDLAHLILSDGTAQAENARRSIARDYYRASEAEPAARTPTESTAASEVSP